ncbi:MAG: hypothetical protein V9G19_13465 [Tetrasphaera sp.]
MVVALSPVTAVEITFGERTGRIVLLAIVFVPFVVFVWASRDRLVGNEIRRLQRLASLPDAGVDQPLLVQRLRQRQTGRAIGVTVAMLIMGLALVWADPVMPWIVFAAPIGAGLGTVLGQLRPLAAGPRPRLAQLRRREIGDYVTPLELRLLVGAFATVPLALALIVVAAATGSPPVGRVLIGCALLVLVTAAAWLIRAATARVLGSSVELGSVVGLEWEEVIRAQTLRDVVGAAACLAAGGSAGVLWWLSGNPGFPQWFEAGAMVLVASALALVLVLVLAATADSRFAWARGHALAGLDG